MQLEYSKISTLPIELGNNVNAYQEKSKVFLFLTKTSDSKIIDSRVNFKGESTLKYLEKNKSRVFNNSLALKSYFSFQEDISTEKNTTDFILKHKLDDFLLWINYPIVEIFGRVKKTLHITRCWDEEDYHLVLTVFSQQDDMNQLTILEDNLFEKLEKYFNIDYILQYVVIAQR